MSYKKSRSIPAKADKKEQLKFLDTKLLPLIKSAYNNEIKLYFGDAVHLIYGAELGYCWCIKRQEVKSAYGRKRFNVMGAYDVVTSETTVISNDTYITSIEIVELFRQLREKNGDKKVYIILDNAKYQKCELVKETAKQYKIEIVYLPSYSPNLNLIERLWKWLRKKCLCNKYKESFQEFCNDILDTLSKTSNVFIEEISKFLAPNFQVLGE